MYQSHPSDGHSPPSQVHDDMAVIPKKLEIGVTFVSLDVQASSVADRDQLNFLTYVLTVPKLLFNSFRRRVARKTQIIRDFEGIIQPGEMLLVLGRPGSGCSTFLKSLAGNLDGLEIGDKSRINYQGSQEIFLAFKYPLTKTPGISYLNFHKSFEGERVYVAELDVHLPELTLGQTLNFAVSTRSKHPNVASGRDIAVKFGLGTAFNTPIGNAVTRGLSGGEMRRTSLAEACLGGAQFQCWDNSTRGLDSSTARSFIRFLRQSTDFERSTTAMTIYQSSEDIYQVRPGPNSESPYLATQRVVLTPCFPGIRQSHFAVRRSSNILRANERRRRLLQRNWLHKAGPSHDSRFLDLLDKSS